MLEISPETLSPLSEKPATRLAHDILDVIQSYGQHLHVGSDAASGGAWIGKAMFVARVEKQVELDEPIKMIMPSFPWKSVRLVISPSMIVSLTFTPDK